MHMIPTGKPLSVALRQGDSTVAHIEFSRPEVLGEERAVAFLDQVEQLLDASRWSTVAGGSVDVKAPSGARYRCIYETSGGQLVGEGPAAVAILYTHRRKGRLTQAAYPIPLEAIGDDDFEVICAAVLDDHRGRAVDSRAVARSE